MTKTKSSPTAPTPDFKDLMEEYTSKLEQKIAYESQFFRLMADSLPQIVWTANPDGEPEYLNKRWYEFSGQEPGGQNSSWVPALHRDDAERSRKKWRHSVKTGEPFEIEYRLREGSTGNYRWFLCRALAGRDASGKILKWFGTCTDIDDHKKAQEKKDEFIAIASHELKTPVTSIKAFAQLMQRRLAKAGDPDSGALLVKMERQIDKLTNLIKDLLDVSKIESGKLQLQREHFRFDAFVRATVENLQLTTDTHKLIIEGRSNSSVVADKNRLEQVLANLISNGIKYSPQADKIHIKLHKDGKHAAVSVADYGVGIPKKDLRHVFERFYRAQGPKSDTYPGLGLGLYICSVIIQRENGRLWVESTPGKGSIFSFAIPISSKEKADG